MVPDHEDIGKNIGTTSVFLRLEVLSSSHTELTTIPRGLCLGLGHLDIAKERGVAAKADYGSGPQRLQRSCLGLEGFLVSHTALRKRKTTQRGGAIDSAI